MRQKPVRPVAGQISKSTCLKQILNSTQLISSPFKAFGNDCTAIITPWVCDYWDRVKFVPTGTFYFGDVKKVVKVVCKKLNERFLCPTKSDVIDMEIIDADSKGNGDQNKSKSVVLVCEDGSRFAIPLDDCAMLPIMHATVEELAIYVWGEILDGLDPEQLRRRGIHTMEVVMAEAPGQEAVFRLEIPETSTGDRFRLDVPSFIRSGEIELTPKPCLSQEETSVAPNKLEVSDTSTASRISASESTVAHCSPNSLRCDESCSLSSFSKQLEALAAALNEKRPSDRDLTADDLRSLLEKK